MFGRSLLPNALTSLNLLFGCLAVVEIFEGNYVNSIYYVFLSGIADFFDGFAARLMKSASNIGKDLDSLADMVSFGLVPSLVLYKMIQGVSTIEFYPYLGFMVAIFSALRLAKFNNDPRQSDTFFGLPVPANALFICALPLFDSQGVVGTWLMQDWLLVIITIVMSLLLISDVKLLALKFKSFALKGNEARYLVILFALVLLLIFKLQALPFIILFYFFTSLIVNIVTKES